MSASETNGRTLPIFLIGGCKGGVGKSMVGEALVDDLLRRGARVLLVETDISVPDVWRAYEHMPGVEGLTLDLDDVDGWIVLGTTLSRHPGRVAVVNTAARNDRGIVSYGSMLTRALAKLRRPLVTLWVINRQRDSLELLDDYLRVMPGALTHVIRNGHFGPTGKFELYNGSRFRERIEAAGGRSLTFPDLADRVSDALRLGRLAIARALDEREARIDFGSRIELERWREETRALFDAIVPPLEGHASGERGDALDDPPSAAPGDAPGGATAPASG